MRIFTVAKNEPGAFDADINYLLSTGWQLTRRELVQTPAGTKDYFYAELVQLDPDPEPEEIDPVKALQVIIDTCKNVPECGSTCPLWSWCQAPSNNITISPNGWVTPEGGADA